MSVGAVEFALRTRATGAAPKSCADEAADWILSTTAAYENHKEDRTPLADQPMAYPLREDPTFQIFKAIDGDRGQILAAVAKLGSEADYWALTNSKVRSESGVSARRFTALYENLSDCYSDASETSIAAVVSRTNAALPPHLDLQRRLLYGSLLLSKEVTRSRLLGVLGLIEAFSPGSEAVMRRDQTVTAYAAACRSHISPEPRPSKLLLSLSIYAVLNALRGEAEYAHRVGTAGANPLHLRVLVEALQSVWPQKAGR